MNKPICACGKCNCQECIDNLNRLAKENNAIVIGDFGIPGNLEHKVEVAICRNCQRPYPRMKFKNSRGKGIGFGIKGMNSKTCSKKCSRAFNQRFRRSK